MAPLETFLHRSAQNRCLKLRLKDPLSGGEGQIPEKKAPVCPKPLPPPPPPNPHPVILWQLSLLYKQV